MKFTYTFALILFTFLCGFSQTKTKKGIILKEYSNTSEVKISTSTFEIPEPLYELGNKKYKVYLEIQNDCSFKIRNVTWDTKNVDSKTLEIIKTACLNNSCTYYCNDILIPTCDYKTLVIYITIDGN